MERLSKAPATIRSREKRQRIKDNISIVGSRILTLHPTRRGHGRMVKEEEGRETNK